MNINKNLVLVNNQDRTKDIRSYVSRDGRFIITFNDGATFPYSYSSIEFFQNPTEINPDECYIIKNKQLLFNITRIQNFGRYTRIIYKNDYIETVKSGEIQLVHSCLSDPKSNNRFEYLKQIAYAVSLHSTDGGNILGNRYSKIDFVREDSILASFLSGNAPNVKRSAVKTVVYPFGFNASQKEAVDNALNNSLSIIEGPPGTGKTQTILNIIANAVMRGESVAVVSSNNSAIANVYEKLMKYDLDFIVAFLGSSTNKEAFIESQNQLLPHLQSWMLNETEYNQIKTKLTEVAVELDEMLKQKNNLSKLMQELDTVRLEQQHFLQYYDETSDKDIYFRSIRNMNSSALLKLWIKSEEYVAEQKPITIWRKALNFLQFGIYNPSFYQNSTERIVAICQKQYYIAAQNELQKRISGLNKLLSVYSFDDKTNEYSRLSMTLFKSDVAKRYMSGDKRQIYEVEDLWKKSEQFITDYPVILSTTYSLRSSLSTKTIYDYVIVDEASQVDLATGALALSCAKKAVIVGDLKQLPNVVNDQTKKKTDTIFESFSLPEVYRYSDHSLLSSVIELFDNLPRVMLKEHYRCHPKIIEFCNQKFYNNQLIILTSPKTDRQPLVAYQTVEGNHARDRVNQRQIDVIKEEVIPGQKLDINNGSIGIVSPYCNHTEALLRTFEGTSVKAATVDKFQGQEKDTIILCTVDNEITDFTGNPSRLNVAVSRAVNQLILVTDGNTSQKDNNIRDLISYIQYNNMEIIQSEIYSVFDYLYKRYFNRRQELLRNKKRVSGYDSENLMYHLIYDVLKAEPFAKLDVISHVPLNMIIRDPHLLNDEETAYAMHYQTHVDFLLYNRLGKQPVLVVEVDGYSYHKPNTRQAQRDELKDQILQKYNIPIVRFKTNGSDEKKRLIDVLHRIIY